MMNDDAYHNGSFHTSHETLISVLTPIQVLVYLTSVYNYFVKELEENVVNL